MSPPPPTPSGGDSHMKGAGMLVGNYELKETTLGVAQFFFFFIPKSDLFKL